MYVQFCKCNKITAWIKYSSPATYTYVGSSPTVIFLNHNLKRIIVNCTAWIEKLYGIITEYYA